MSIYLQQGFRVILLAVLTGMLLILGGCTPILEAPLETTPHEGESGIALDQTVQFSQTDLSADFPGKWIPKLCDTFTVVGELETDLDLLCRDQRKPQAIAVGLDHQGLAFMRSIGLPADPTLEDLMALNIDFFELDVSEIVETTFAGEPALRYRAISKMGPAVHIVSIVEDEAFLFSLNTPNEERMEEALPIFDAILASARRIE